MGKARERGRLGGEGAPTWGRRERWRVAGWWRI
jgi:hypothetical protein